MDKNLKKLLLLTNIAILLLCIASIEALDNFESDRVVSLPGQPASPSISQFSGYITVNQPNGRALFYWFFEALSQPSNKPLLLWFNGGPGCSSIGYGAAVEFGPLNVNGNGGGLFFNNFSWIQEANLLFVDSPVGVGFSYSNTSSDYAHLNDQFVAEDSYSFTVNWLEKYPQFQNHDLYIAGESYGGHYVPQLAELIFDGNNDNTSHTKINLKGFIVGNPITDDYYDNKGMLEYAWSTSVISDDLYDNAKQVCDFKTVNWSDDCKDAISSVYDKYKEIDIYNIYAPICLLNETSSTPANYADKEIIYGMKRVRIFSDGDEDPCYSTYAEEYFNRVDVQQSLHVITNDKDARSGFQWTLCNDNILNAYNFSVQSILPIYKKLIQGGLKIWIYSGDVDGRVPVIGTRYWVEALGLPMKTPWRSWYHNHQVGGRLVEYQGIALVTVRGAGHLVPLYKPSEALALIHAFFTGEQLPAQRY